MATNRITRKAVALKYDPRVHSAPEVVAKGGSQVAEKIIQLAQQHEVPVYEDRNLVEALSKLDLGTKIPPELYQAMAEVLVFFYQLNKRWYKNIPAEPETVRGKGGSNN